VTAPDFAVDFAEALREWLLADKPSNHEYDALERWAKNLEHTGPPAIVGYTSDGLLVAVGPSDERVAHEVLAVPLGLGPPYGIIAIKFIVSRPTAL
jgi:hypothetical protein